MEKLPTERFLSHYRSPVVSAPVVGSPRAPTAPPPPAGGDYSRLVADVCQVFKDVTGVVAAPEREHIVIEHWGKLGWQVHDFRRVIEFEFSDPSQREYYGHPGRMNLRMMLNPARRERLIDIHADLIAAAHREKKLAEMTTPSRERKLHLRCGAKIHRKDYDSHLSRCFELKGGCFI